MQERVAAVGSSRHRNFIRTIVQRSSRRLRYSKRQPMARS
jgi:hypothetical protein